MITNQQIKTMTTQEKSDAHELLKIGIETLLKSYSETLTDFEAELIDYQRLQMDSLIELKQEHVNIYKGKIEVLTYLNK